MGNTREGGLFYIRGVAVNSEGQAIEDAPPFTPYTDTRTQPGGQNFPSQADVIAEGMSKGMVSAMQLIRADEKKESEDARLAAEVANRERLEEELRTLRAQLDAAAVSAKTAGDAKVESKDAPKADAKPTAAAK